MDKQIALMKRYQKNENTIAYVHSDEIILIKREFAEDGTAFLCEITLNAETESVVTKRVIDESEMKLSEFDEVKATLTETTIADFNEDWRVTHLDVGLERLENTDEVCTASVEEEYIAEQDELERLLNEAKNPMARTMKNAIAILDSCLTETQKRRYISYFYKDKTIEEIADEENVNINAVAKSLNQANKKIEKYFSEIPQKGCKKCPKKL